ncbi:hypothetical protein H310_05417 [Aphanomyces invadans]|uniref:Uncharacterized protein n=1 Tax=Aphanomyces invadans TaxID=157072 RepID=A0A024U992_9STRA|nr:hypothetical protein H310_05417 [Aphanomyces invadans]ETW02976.1 hypothetical protein H310_05417 [Aphanomyces invadans]|eukprot:XP_008868360.1 hypothetical protein H310_05417 [Aphanomyces invadans]
MFGGLARLRGGGPGAPGPHGFGDCYHLVVMREHSLHIFQCTRRRCRCYPSSILQASTGPTNRSPPCTLHHPLPSPHHLDFEPWQQLPLDTLTNVWLPYQTHGQAVATRRSDVILRWADTETGWLSFSHNQARGEFLDYIQRLYGHTLVIDHLDLDEPSNLPADNTTVLDRNWSFLTNNGGGDEPKPTMCPQPPPAPVPTKTEAHLDPAPGLVFGDRHSSAYEATLLTLYMQLPEYNALPSHKVTVADEGLAVALLAQVMHGISLALEGNTFGMPLLTMVVEGAICLDRIDLHALCLVGVALAECRGQRFTAALAHIETSYRLSWESGHDVGCFIASVGQYDVHCAQAAWDSAYASLRRAQVYAPAKYKPMVHSKVQALHSRMQGKDAPPSEAIHGWRRVLSPRRSSDDLIASSLKPPHSYFTTALLDEVPVADLMFPSSSSTSVLVKVSPHRQYRMAYEPQWTVHDFLSHLVARHEHTVQQKSHHLPQPPSASHNSCIVGLVFDVPSHHHSDDQVLGLRQPFAAVLAASPSSNRFRAILADRPVMPAVASGVTVACTLCQRQIPLEQVETHSHECY